MPWKSLANLKALAEKLAHGEQLELVEHLARRLREADQLHTPPADLYGVWKGIFPDDFDAEKVIDEVRSAWKQELSGIGP